MSVITIFSGTFCKENAVMQETQKKTGYKSVTDNDVIVKAGKISDMAENKIRSAFSAKTSVFNKFTHEKERSLAWLRLAAAEILSEDNLLIYGFTGHPIPKEISHVLRCCLIADMKSGAASSQSEQKLSEKEAVSFIHKQDEDRAVWVKIKDPWDASLYDIIIPTDKMSIDEIVSLIEKNFYAKR